MKKQKRCALFLLLFLLGFIFLGSQTEISAKQAIKTISLKVEQTVQTKKTYKIKKGKMFTIRAAIMPEIAVEKLTFSSSKKSVATVSKKGVVTAKKAGTAKISVKVKEKNGKTTATWMKVKVSNPSLKNKRILMIGNSYTYCNDLPKTLAKKTGAKIVASTQGGAGLYSHLSEEYDLGKKTRAYLKNQKWDYVIIQEQSLYPAIYPDLYLNDLKQMCDLVHENGAVPAIYGTWAYQKGSSQLENYAFGLTYEQMYENLHKSFVEGAKQNRAALIDAGTLFYKKSPSINLYRKDGSHPNEKGSELVANLMKKVLLEEEVKR